MSSTTGMHIRLTDAGLWAAQGSTPAGTAAALRLSLRLRRGHYERAWGDLLVWERFEV